MAHFIHFMIILRVVFVDIFFFLELKVSVGCIKQPFSRKGKTNFTISSTLKSFLHFSALATISFVFVRSNLRVRRNLKCRKKKKRHTTTLSNKINNERRGATSKASHHPFFPSQRGLGLLAPPSVYPEFVVALPSGFPHALGEDGS